MENQQKEEKAIFESLLDDLRQRMPEELNEIVPRTDKEAFVAACKSMEDELRGLSRVEIMSLKIGAQARGQKLEKRYSALFAAYSLSQLAGKAGKNEFLTPKFKKDIRDTILELAATHTFEAMLSDLLEKSIGDYITKLVSSQVQDEIPNGEGGE